MDLSQGRCRHWHGRDDVLLLRLLCCPPFWGCRDCHDEVADHVARRWPAGADAAALECGRCGERFGIQAYLADPERCPGCGGGFNPGCRSHHHLYFDVARPK